MAIPVTTDNFVRAETDRYFGSFAKDAGGVNRWKHSRGAASVEHQLVIRMNRDTLYSFAVVDISEGATVTLPDSGDRYVSVMVVNQDHYINDVFHGAGRHELTVDRFDTPYVALAARILVDASDRADLAAANSIQDGLQIEAASARPFEPTEYDVASLDETRRELLSRGKGGLDTRGMFGRREDVDREKHLEGTAQGWGGLPQSEASYIGSPLDQPLGEYRVTLRDVPVDAFWSISVYNKDGYFEPNDRGAYNVNSVMAQKDDDGSITVHFGGCDDGRANCLPIVEGWNYAVRLYRPRTEVLDGSYVFPTPVLVDAER
jgi:hypothetical protein